ncbi:MAG: hypothetical protein P1P88_26370 [Bacteroidales bacterium]|nr:hypothetical protein [Bacteroidales bacterium]
MSKNILIVESDNDKFFIEAFISHLELTANLAVDSPICTIDDFECLGGMANLKFRLNELKVEIEKGNINKIGIIIDADQEGIDKR